MYCANECFINEVDRVQNYAVPTATTVVTNNEEGGGGRWGGGGEGGSAKPAHNYALTQLQHAVKLCAFYASRLLTVYVKKLN